MDYPRREHLAAVSTRLRLAPNHDVAANHSAGGGALEHVQSYVNSQDRAADCSKMKPHIMGLKGTLAALTVNELELLSTQEGATTSSCPDLIALQQTLKLIVNSTCGRSLGSNDGLWVHNEVIFASQVHPCVELNRP